MKILCKIGIHRWGKKVKISHGFTSNVYDVKQKCERCHKTRIKVEPKKN